MLPRSPSSTAIPLRFRRPPVSPIIFREAIQDSTSAPESPMTPTTSNMRRRASRPPSAEFKTNHEFRPLYLLESTRKIPEPEDNLPSLPSSRTTSRSSSVQGGSDDNFESARESPETFSASGGIAADMDIANVADDRLPDVLDSGQTTPRAGTSPRSLDHVDALDSVLNTSNSLQSATGALIAGGLVTAAHASLELHTDGTRSKLKKDESGSEGNSQDTSDPDKHTDVNADIESSEDFQATKSAFELDDLPSTKTETEEKQRQRSIGVIPEPGDDMASLVANIMNTTRTSAHSASPGETSRNSGHVDLGPQHPRLDALQIREESKELHINQEVEAKRAVESASRESFEQESAPSKDGTKSENTEDGTPLQQDPLSPSSIPEVFDPFQYMVIEDPDKGVESGNSNVTTTQSVINIPEGSRQTTTTLPSDDEPELEPSSDRRDEMVAVQREKGGPNKRTTESQLSKRGSKKESKKSSQRISSEGTWLSSLFGSKKSKKDGKGGKKKDRKRSIDNGSDQIQDTTAQDPDTEQQTNLDNTLDDFDDLVLADESKSLGAEQESGSEDNFWKVDDTDDTVPTAQSNVTFPLAADLVQSSQSHAISGSAEEKTEQEETRELASLPQTLAVTNASASEQDEWSIPLSAKSRKKAKKDRKSQKERTPSKVDVPRSQSSVSDTDTTKMNNTAGVKLQPQELELRNPESEDEWSTSLPKGKTKSKQDKKRTSSSSIIPNKNELVLMPSAEYAAVSKLTPEVSESIPADSEQQTDPARLDVEAEWSSVSVKTKKKAKKDKERSSVITPKAIESDHSAVLDSKHDSDKSSKSIAIEDDRVSSNLQEESNGLVVLSDKQPVKANDGPPGLSPSEDEITEREANMATDETGMDSNASTHVRQTFDVSSDFDRGEGTVSTSPQHVQKQYRSHIDMEIRNEVSDQLDLSSTSREEEREEESYQHAQAAGVNEPSSKGSESIEQDKSELKLSPGFVFVESNIGAAQDRLHDTANKAEIKQKKPNEQPATAWSELQSNKNLLQTNQRDVVQKHETSHSSEEPLVSKELINQTVKMEDPGMDTPPLKGKKKEEEEDVKLDSENDVAVFTRKLSKKEKKKAKKTRALQDAGENSHKGISELPTLAQGDILPEPSSNKPALLLRPEHSDSGMALDNTTARSDIVTTDFEEHSIPESVGLLMSKSDSDQARSKKSKKDKKIMRKQKVSAPEWITEANQDTEEVKATAAEQATTIDEPNSIAATEAKTLEQQEIKVYRAESGEGAKLRSDLSIGAAVQTTTASTLTLEQEELQESDHSRELVIAEDVQSPSITKGKSVGEGAKEVESMASDFEWSKKSKKQKRKKMADWTDGHTLQDEDNESGNKSLFADSVLAAMGAAGTVTNAENLRNDEADLLDSTTDPPGKQSKKDKKKAKVQKKQRSVDAVTVSAKPSNVIAEARNDGQDDDALTLSSHGTDRTGNEHENRIVDNGEPKKGLEFDDIVLAAMDDAGFNSKSVSVKTSQERIEEEKGVMDFGPASQTHSPLQKGRDSVPSPSSLWRLSRSPTYSPRQSPKPSRDPSDHQQEVSSAESKTKAHEDSPSSDLTTVGKVWGESEDPKRVDIHTRGGSADIETTTIPSRSTEEPSWSFAGLDHGMPNVTQHSTQDNDLQVCPGTEGVPLDSIRDSIHENDCYDPLIPDTPKVLATYATNESPAESLTTTKNRSSGLFKSPPSVRGSADVSTSLNDSSTTEEQRETPSLEDDQRQSRDFRLESKDLDTIAENEREHSPSHEHARSFSELTRSDHSVKVPERLRHLQDAKGLRAVQDVAEDEASTREALEAESLLDPISPTLDRAAARNVRQTNRMSSSTPSGTSSPGAELANNGRTYARAPGRDSGSPAEISRSKSALSNRSMTPGMIDMTDGSPSLRRVERSVGSDLRGASKRDAALAAFSNDKTEGTRGVPPASSKPPTPSYQPLKGAGKDRRQDMSEPGSNLEGWGAPSLSSPRSSPSRPPSIRKRQSTHILDLERQLDQLASENRALQETRARRLSGENFFPPSPRHEEAVKARDLEIQEKDLEIHSIKTSLETLQTEVTRLTRHNTELQNTQNDERYASLEAQHQDVHAKWQTSSRDLETLQQKHDNLSRSMETVVRGEIDDALEEKDNEIRGLRIELDQATDKIHALQQQLALTRKGEDYLNVRDEDYFDSACQQLCQHVQQWVLRYSKFSDTRACRMSHQVKDEKIETRLDNAILDGSDVDNYLSDRVRRRDVFMSVVMTMIWEFVFTRYLFGMDRDQRQKLKALEKTLTDVGPTRAVAQWRATTLTLLSRRDVFVEQRAQDTEAVVQEIYGTLSRLLPPPTHLAEQIQDSLRNVMRLAVNLSIEMRTQRAEYIMLPPLQPEYDTNGELARKVFFNASLMNERSGETSSNEELENQQAVVRLVLFPLVVKKGNDMGESDEEVVVCPAQVLIARSGKDKKVVRVMSGPTNASMYSIVPPGALDPENVV